MDFETKLMNWFDEIDTEFFDVVSHCKKLEDMLNDATTSGDNIPLHDVDSNKDRKICHKNTCEFVRTSVNSGQPQHNNFLNLCDVFELCKRELPRYGVTKVDTRNEIENEHFCKIVEFLIKTEYFDVHDKDWYQGRFTTPLYRACMDEEDHKHLIIKCPNFKCIELLLANGADINIKFGITGNTLLHQFLKESGKTDDKTCLGVLKLFMKYGYDINTVSSIGYTLLHTACAFRKTLITNLIELGIDTTLKDAYGRDAFTHLYIYNAVTIDDLREDKDMWNTLSQSGIHVKAKDNNDCNLLMVLVHLTVSPYKLTNALHEGCDVNAVDKCGRTALHHVMLTGESSMSQWSYNYIDILIDAGIDCHIKDKFDKTAFQYIVYYSQEEQVRFISYIFKHFGQLFSQLDLKVPLTENDFLRTYENTKKQLTKLLGSTNFDSSAVFFSAALNQLTEENVYNILHTKGIGATENIPEFQLVQNQVNLVMNRLATHLSEYCKPLTFKAQAAGSVSEKCKVGLPDEFDYLFIIEGMDIYFEIEQSQTPGFASIKRKAIDNFPKDFCNFVNENDYMMSITFLHYFSQKILETLQRNNIWEHTSLYHWESFYESKDFNHQEFKPKANFLLDFRCPIPNFKDISISVDVVPALAIPHNELVNFLPNNDQVLDSPKLLVLPTKSEVFNFFPSRISTSIIETGIISTLPRYLRNAFMLLKILKELGQSQNYDIPYHHDLTTYHLKTLLLTSDEISKANGNFDQKGDDSKPILEAARKMIEQFAKFEDDVNMPSFIFKNNLLANRLPTENNYSVTFLPDSSDSEEDDDDSKTDDSDTVVLYY